MPVAQSERLIMKVEVQGGEVLMVMVPSGGMNSSAGVAIVSEKIGQIVTVMTADGRLASVTQHDMTNWRTQKQDPNVCSPLDGRHNVSCRINDRGHTCDRIGMPEERLALWAHLVSEHACALSMDTPLEVLVDVHKNEHKGPGTIRNHDESLRGATHARLIEVLSERDDVFPSMSEGQLRAFTKRIHNEISRRLGQAVDELQDNSDLDEVYWAAARDMWGQVAKLVESCRERMESLSKTFSEESPNT